MIISLCIPCMNRTYNLKKTLPDIVKAANASPPVEIVIVNYNSKDDLDEYITDSQKNMTLAKGNFWNYRKLTTRNYYNSAHARNLCVITSKGDYIIQLSTEALLRNDFVTHIRHLLETEKPVWACENSNSFSLYNAHLGRFIVCQRKEFIKAGGYDERFEFYAPEDKDICHRLHRRGGKFVLFPSELAGEIYTPNEEKVKNYDLRSFGKSKLFKREMAKRMKPIYEESMRNQTLVANQEKGWGKWR